jgi:hypothetical protein
VSKKASDKGGIITYDQYFTFKKRTSDEVDLFAMLAFINTNLITLLNHGVNTFLSCSQDAQGIDKVQYTWIFEYGHTAYYAMTSTMPLKKTEVLSDITSSLMNIEISNDASFDQIKAAFDDAESCLTFLPLWAYSDVGSDVVHVTMIKQKF